MSLLVAKPFLPIIISRLRSVFPHQWGFQALSQRQQSLI
jgi:hypothetical protein